MNLRPGRRPEEPEINVVSLIDVVLLLVVFFILSAKFTDEGRLRVHLPHASDVPEARQAAEPLVVSVTQGGTYLVNQHELINSSPETLRAALAEGNRHQPQHAHHAAGGCPRHPPVRHHRHGRARTPRLRRGQHRNGQG